MRTDDFTPKEIQKALATLGDVLEIHLGGYVKPDAEYRLAKRFLTAAELDVEARIRKDQACARARKKMLEGTHDEG